MHSLHFCFKLQSATPISYWGWALSDLIGQAIEANVIFGSGMSHLLRVFRYRALDIEMSVNNVWENWNSYREDTLSWMELKHACMLIIRPWSSTPWLLLLTTLLATSPGSLSHILGVSYYCLYGWDVFYIMIFYCLWWKGVVVTPLGMHAKLQQANRPIIALTK